MGSNAHVQEDIQRIVVKAMRRRASVPSVAHLK